MDKIVLVASDLSGKPVAAGIAKTFSSGDRVKIKNLSDDIVTDYSNLSTELVLKSLGQKMDIVFSEYGSGADYFLVCGGACLNIALVACWAEHQGVELNYLVWEKKQGKYIGVNSNGRLIDFEDGSGRLNSEESEEDTSRGK